MFFKQIDLTAALRPSLLPNEALIFVQDGVGLYEGKFKIPNCQQGYAYLTSLRVCYVDENEPRKSSVALDLREVDRVEYQAGFLKTSPKIILHPKLPKHGSKSIQRGDSKIAMGGGSSTSPISRTSSPLRSPWPPTPTLPSNATWICPICSFSNQVPTDFEPGSSSVSAPLPSCLACGIKPPFAVVLKAAIAAASKRSALPGHDPQLFSTTRTTDGGVSQPMQPETTVVCSRCTFLNHITLSACEICGAPLRDEHRSTAHDADPTWKAESSRPQVAEVDLRGNAEIASIKISFRAGGDKTFHDRLKGALTQRKWLLLSAPPVPNPSPLPVTDKHIQEISLAQSAVARPTSTPVGIAGLERRDMESRKNNEVVIGTAFEDLEALMASAKEIVALAEKFAVDSGRGVTDASSVLSQSAAALGMVTTKDKLNSGSDNLYFSELSRNLAEYLTDDQKGILHAEGGIMSLIDLWAVFNRSRNGVELVSPLDFHKAAQMWEKLSLPVRLRRFKSGLLVVQRLDWNDDKTIRQFKTWLQQLRQVDPPDEVPWDWSRFGCGVNAQETASRFGWSVGVALEELEMAEDKGVLCRDEGIEGVRFWINYFAEEDGPAPVQ